MRVDPSWPYLGVLTLGAMLVALIPCGQWASSETVEASELAKVMFLLNSACSAMTNVR